LAHSRSAIKRLRQSLDRRTRNRSTRSETRTLVAKAASTISHDLGAAESDVRAAVSALDRAAQKGVIHPNVASRGKARLLKRFNLAVARQVAAAASAAPPAAAEAPEAEAKAPRRRAAAAKPEAAAEAPARKTRASKPAAKEKDASPGEKPAPRTRSRKTTS